MLYKRTVYTRLLLNVHPRSVQLYTRLCTTVHPAVYACTPAYVRIQKKRRTTVETVMRRNKDLLKDYVCSLIFIRLPVRVLAEVRVLIHYSLWEWEEVMLTLLETYIITSVNSLLSMYEVETAVSL